MHIYIVFVTWIAWHCLSRAHLMFFIPVEPLCWTASVTASLFTVHTIMRLQFFPSLSIFLWDTKVALFTTIFLVRLSPTCFMSPPVLLQYGSSFIFHLSLVIYWSQFIIEFYMYEMHVRSLFSFQQCLHIYFVVVIAVQYFTPSYFLYFIIIEYIVFISAKWMSTSSNIVSFELCALNISIIILAVSKYASCITLLDIKCAFHTQRGYFMCFYCTKRDANWFNYISFNAHHTFCTPLSIFSLIVFMIRLTSQQTKSLVQYI